MPFVPMDPISQLELARQTGVERRAEAEADALASTVPLTSRGRILQDRLRAGMHRAARNRAA